MLLFNRYLLQVESQLVNKLEKENHADHQIVQFYSFVLHTYLSHTRT